MSSQELIQKEILDLHALFQAWYTGQIGQTDLNAVIGGHLAENFYIVFPDATKQSKAELLEMMSKDYAIEQEFRIEIKDMNIQALSEEFFLANYQEWQFGKEGTDPQLKLKSSSIIKKVGDACSWIAIHETKIP